MTDAEKIAELQAAVTRLEGIVNVARYMSDRLGVDDWTQAKNAAPVLPSGDRNVYDRMREIGISQDEIVEEKMPALEERLEIAEAENRQLRARIAALEAGSSQPPASVEGGLPFSIADGSNPAVPAGTRVVSGNVVFADRVGIRGLHPRGRAPLHIVQDDAPGDRRAPASVLYWSNLDGSQYQSPSDHVAEEGLSDDGGFRRAQNCMNTMEDREDYDPDVDFRYRTNWLAGVNPTRPSINEGFDSQCQPSWDHRYHKQWLLDRGLPEDFYNRTQTVVMRFDPTQKLALFECWQRGWRFKFGAEAKYGPGIWTGAMP